VLTCTNFLKKSFGTSPRGSTSRGLSASVAISLALSSITVSLAYELSYHLPGAAFNRDCPDGGMPQFN
jgi:hypothetical protein